MESLPLFHRLQGAKVLLLGEGEAAEAKARLVREAGGEPVAEVEPGVRLAFVALAEGAEEAAARLRAGGLLVNVADRPELCDFFVPAIVDRSPVVAAVGTGGASASLAKALKERLELFLPVGLGALANAIRQARPSVSAAHPEVADRRGFWARLLAPGGALDPLASVADPAEAISLALAGGYQPEDRFDTIQVGEGGAEALTLRELRLMAQADLVIQEPGVPAEVLALVRRDAARRVGEEVLEGDVGRVVLIRLG
ncbi:siroheme synthase [Sandaracinobacter sp. RS1-74]|uniref:precorrin-2 dehydrogenase/sirohydrochlorin ferrochelatase family protein n=1 Tax=Sandaracinobacteroides sayramensis TaxID=2913411 RepID=UPI001EDBCF35|nr:NAD(P)-dependent oxidoreductase [Sandaracinobacteroides sayramensis]MCG2841784.1 siroheme synthase [Sandaracinobacteroides sayramensis]